MLRVAVPFVISCAVALAAPTSAGTPLKTVKQLPPALDTQLWVSATGKQGDKKAMLRALDDSLKYLSTAKSAGDYKNYPVSGITRDRVRRSVQRFRQLVVQSTSPEALEKAVKREFTFYKSVGDDGQGNVLFTGYYEATFSASRRPTAEFKYPLYKAPSDLAQWPTPNPTRAQIEGTDGLQGSKGKLKGLELVWLRDRFEAFLVQIQGSARLQMTDGSTMSVGFAGKTKHPYVSIGKEMITDELYTLDQMSLPTLIKHFKENPQDQDRYLPRNPSFVFFRETNGAPPMGSINVPVTAERSIATDKSIMPPGALALIRTELPYFNRDNQLEFKEVSRFIMDHDTGSAIQGPGRVDVFMGTGDRAAARAGVIKSSGAIYYLLLR
ncbi:MAG: MltA domain-containing protein [Thermosynechococcaceae cyanobacterium]